MTPWRSESRVSLPRRESSCSGGCNSTLHDGPSCSMEYPSCEPRSRRATAIGSLAADNKSRRRHLDLNVTSVVGPIRAVFRVMLTNGGSVANSHARAPVRQQTRRFYSRRADTSPTRGTPRDWLYQPYAQLITLQAPAHPTSPGERHPGPRAGILFHRLRDRSTRRPRRVVRNDDRFVRNRRQVTPFR